jgi:CHAT domain-containing protein/Tfp pilus assembly protein PilF
MQVRKRIIGTLALMCALWLAGAIIAQDEQSGACTVSAASDVNRRSAPGTDYDIVGTLAAGQTGVVDRQAIGEDGFTWWRLEDGGWVRSDVVNEQGDCANVLLMDLPEAVAADKVDAAWDAFIEGADLLDTNDLDGALARFQAALSGFREMGVVEGEGPSLTMIGQVYFRLGDYDSALETYEVALEVLRSYDNQSLVSVALGVMGRMYEDRGQYRQVLDVYQQKLAVCREIGDRDCEGGSLSYIGHAHGELGEHTLALDTYEQALAIADELENLEAKATVLSNIGFSYVALASYADALAYFQQALGTQRMIGDREGEGTTLNNIGFVYSEIGQSDQALDYYQQALEIHRAEGDLSSQRNTLINIGTIYHTQGEYDQALDYYQSALAIAQELHDRGGEARALNSIGGIYDLWEQYDQAMEYYQDALTISREVGDRLVEAAALNNIGMIYYTEGQSNLALDYAQQALTIHQAISQRQNEVLGWSNLATVYESLGRLQDAIESYAQAVDLIESIHADIRLEVGQASFAAKNESTRPYDRLVALMIDSDPATAFHYAERGRARAFLFQLSNEQLAFGQGADAQLLADWQAKRDQIVALRARRVELASQLIPDAAAISEIDDQIAEAERELSRLGDQIAVQNPALGQLTRVDVPDLATIQAAIPDDTTLLAYYVTNSDVFAFILTNTDFNIAQLELPPEELRVTVTVFRADERMQTASLEQLYDGLIEPLMDYLTTPNLVIAAHDVLNYVPFAALKIDDGHYLADDFTVRYIPSATVFAVLAQRSETPSGGTPLVLGNPDAADPQLRPLPFAEAEASAIGAELGVNAFLNTDATEALLRGRVGESSLIHIAAHGVFNTRNPLSSYLALAPDSENDGFLEMREVYALPLQEHSPLVVLSACQTAVGGLTAGDEFQGLTRAFLLSGARTMVASLWSVDDQATSELMTAFYRYREQGMSDAEALAQAQATVRLNVDHPEWAEPYYWAAFVLTGRS